MDYPGFVGASYQSQSINADAERLVNFYVENMEVPNASVRSVLYPTPGFTTINSVGIGPGRAHLFVADREFAVIGSTLYDISFDGQTMTSLGTVGIDANPATISYNGDAGGQLFITSGGNGFCFDLATSVLTQITALNGIATMGDFVDGFFLAMNSNTGTWYISAIYDGTSWTTGTDFAQRSIASDLWRALKVQGRYIWLLGDQTSEIWYNSGGASFPFTPHTSGGYIPYGVAAPFSVATDASSITWLSTTRTGGVRVCRSEGFTPEEISTFPIQTTFADYDLAYASGDTYHDRGHNFYMIHIPRENISWGWDAQTRTWAERGTWNPTLDAFGVSRARHHVYAWGEHRWLDAVNGAVYKMDPNVGTDVDGLLIRRIRRAPHLSTSGTDLNFYAGFELDLETGLGVTTGQGSDPQVMLRTSDDGGKTWGAEMWRSAGKIGNYERRVQWNRLGAGRRRVFEVTMTDPIPWRIMNAYVHLGQQPRGPFSRAGGGGPANG